RADEDGEPLARCDLTAVLLAFVRLPRVRPLGPRGRSDREDRGSEGDGDGSGARGGDGPTEHAREGITRPAERGRISAVARACSPGRRVLGGVGPATAPRPRRLTPMAAISRIPLMDVGTLKTELKSLIVRELNLEGRDPATIQDDAPLFGDGLGLDSL